MGINKTKKKSVFRPQNDKIKKNIEEWNTLKHVYRYKTLYKICSLLYLLTYNNQLACLNYYVDTETDFKKTYTVMYAEIELTASLPIKERVLKHIKLLRDIRNGVELEHDFKHIDCECSTLFELKS